MDFNGIKSNFMDKTLVYKGQIRKIKDGSGKHILTMMPKRVAIMPPNGEAPPVTSSDAIFGIIDYSH